MNGAHLCLFSGTGIPSQVAREIGFRTVGYVEADPHCQSCIRQRIREGSLDDAPIFADVRAFNGLPFSGRVDLISAGFPCQPFSVAGKRKGEADERNLWPHTIRIVREVRPALALFENVPGILFNPYFGTILNDLETSGYQLVGTSQIVSAYEVGAPHKRERLFWIASDAERDELRNESRRFKGQNRQGKTVPSNNGEAEFMADAESVSERESANEAEPKSDERNARTQPCSGGWWTTEPDVGRVAHGVERRMVRLRALGNGWVPQQAIEAVRRIVE